MTLMIVDTDVKQDGHADIVVATGTSVLRTCDSDAAAERCPVFKMTESFVVTVMNVCFVEQL